jgi:hypothetical protein
MTMRDIHESADAAAGYKARGTTREATKHSRAFEGPDEAAG